MGVLGGGAKGRGDYMDARMVGRREAHVEDARRDLSSTSLERTRVLTVADMGRMTDWFADCRRDVAGWIFLLLGRGLHVEFKASRCTAWGDPECSSTDKTIRRCHRFEL